MSPSRDERAATPREAVVDLRLAAPALCAWAAAWCTLTVPLAAGLTIAVATAACIGVGVRRNTWHLGACAVVALTAMLSSLGQQWAVRASPLAEAAQQNAMVEIVAQVRTDPRNHEGKAGRPDSVTLLVSVVQLTSRGETTRLRADAQLVVSGELASELTALKVGQKVVLVGKASEPMDTADKLAARIRPTAPSRVVAPPGALDGLLNRVRDALHDAMAHSDPAQAGLVPSLVVGDTSGLPKDLTQDFRTAGLTHLTAVSGTNLTLMLVFALTIARTLGMRGWPLRALALPVVLGFVLLCRSEPSVVRAAAMGLVALGATGRRGVGPAGLRQLAMAVWILVLADPWLARSWGFALSAFATAGILWWAGRWQQAMRHWSPGWLAESICVPLAAQLATQPLVTMLSGSVSMVSLGANALVAPFIGPVTVLGMAAGALGTAFPMGGIALGWLAGWCVQPVILVARIASDMPAALVTWPASPVAVVVLCACCAGIAWLVARVIARLVWCLVLGIAMIAACLWRPPMPGWPTDWDVVSCDVGQGDATLARSGPHSAVLVDVGPDPAAIANCLRNAGISTVALLVLSHFHADHVGGLEGVYRVASVQAALLNPLVSPAREAAAVHAMISARGTPSRIAAPGDTLVVGEATWFTLQVAPDTGPGIAPTAREGESAAENDSSILGRVARPSFSLLVTGDMGANAQRTANRTIGEGLRTEVLKVPHHGSSDQDDRFLASTQARIALVSAGKNNSYGHPTAKTVGTLSRHSMTVLRTDEHGDIAVAHRGDGRFHVASRR